MENIKDATQEGVSNTDVSSENEESNQSRVISEREQAIAAIDEQVSRMREEEQGISVQKDTQVVNNSVPNEIDQGERQIKVKIDGEELYVPESEIIRNYQKTAAADKRLEQAAIERQRLEEEKRLFEESKKKQAEIPEDNIQATDELEDTTRKIFEEITEGNIDSATKLLADTLKTFKKGETSSADIDKGKISQIFQELNSEKELQQNYRQAKEMFDKDYGFINENPRMTQLANLVFNESIESGRLPIEAARLAGEEVKKMLNFTTNNSQADRQVRKQFIDNIPNANATTSSNNSNSDDDPRAVIEQMKRSRGQA